MLANLKLLILAGGKSTRMGSPKHLLPMPDGRPLYRRQIDVMRETQPNVDTIYISLAQDSQLDDFLREAMRSSDSAAISGTKIEVIIDTETSESEESKGPASGILAAFQRDPDATWLVVACDYPNITTSALEQLMSSYQSPVTCFRNLQGFCEPLLGIWSPEAIKHLQDNCDKGKLSPSKAAKELNGLMVLPSGDVEMLLQNVNTKEEWESALRLLHIPPQ
ncbi:hypothetical protein ACLX1H_008927 [Fusarium chlamydosporum]